MVQGFNHNIKHKGKLFHIQTEDSGRDNPHIITHVFVGGNILATKKTSYADIVKADRLETIVRELMEEQHKSVLRNLINGVYDETGRVATEVGAPATVESTGARVDGSKAEPEKPISKPMPAISKPSPAKPAVAAARPATAPVAATAAVAGAKPSGEKSLDEIILSYLADREE